MRLRGDLDRAISAVDELAATCADVRAQLAGPQPHYGWRAYVDWVHRCERQLRDLFIDDSVATAVLTDRYQMIVVDVSQRSCTQLLIDAEITAQARRLDDLAGRLRGYLCLRDRAGIPAVIDTNVLLHYQQLDKVRWCEVVGERPVRLVIPLVVLDELDEKRYSSSDAIQKKARSAVEPLDRLQTDFDRDGYATLPDRTTIEYLVDDPGHQRQAYPDEEILERAAFLAQVIGQEVAVVTADRGMRVRATSRGAALRAVMMPDRYARHQPRSGSG